VRINRRTAPDLHLDPVAVTREPDGLAIGEAGEPVEWLVPMRLFDNDLLLDRIAAREPLSDLLCREAADSIYTFHNAAEPVRERDAAAKVQHVAETIIAEHQRHRFPRDRIDDLASAWRRMLTANADLLGTRSREGFLRHLHGDLHLRNIVLWQGRPTLFDAIEFDPAIAEIDTLYDLAFLLMDLLHRDQKRAANAVLNRYLQRSGDHVGLPLLPLYLSMRAGIRAHTTASGARSEADRAEAMAYVDLALAVLDLPEPRALAIGGASGTGKSTTAALTAPHIGGAAGAVIIRSDVIRKSLHGKAPEEKLPQSAYTAENSRRVFETPADEAGRTLAAGQSVIVDAVFGGTADTRPLKDILRSLGLRLEGFWLDAPAAVLHPWVRSRTNDASDADEAVLERQLANLQRPAGWRVVDASGTPQDTADNLMKLLD